MKHLLFDAYLQVINRTGMTSAVLTSPFAGFDHSTEMTPLFPPEVAVAMQTQDL